MNKKVIFALIATALVIIFIGLYLYAHFNNSFPVSNFICAHPKNTLIQIGQNKEAIVRMMGQANKDIVKSDVSEDRFGQGDMEENIKEGWIYTFNGWDGNIEIYFDKDGIVIGKNCGNG